MCSAPLLLTPFSLAASGMFSPLMHPLEPVSEAERAQHAQLAQKASISDFLASRSPAARSETGFHYATIEEYHAAYVSGRTTPLEVAQRVIVFLKNQQEHLNAVPELSEADVLEQAAASTERYKSGAQLGRCGVWSDDALRHDRRAGRHSCPREELYPRQGLRAVLGHLVPPQAPQRIYIRLHGHCPSPCSRSHLHLH